MVYSRLIQNRMGIQKNLQPIFSLLEETQNNGKFFHAYCILGPSGIGKSKLALKAAELFLKHDPIKHVDSIILRAEQASSIKDVRGFIDSFHATPLAAKGRVGMIMNADSLTVQAQNALLKTIEEPPQNSLLLLTANNKQKILSTIISRVVSLHARPLTNDEMRESLAKAGMTPQEIEIIQPIAAGRIEWALHFNNPESLQSLKDQIKILKKTFGGEALFRITGELFQRQGKDDEEKQHQLLQIWMTLLRDTLRKEKSEHMIKKLLSCAFAINTALTSTSKENTRLTIERAFLSI